MEIKNIYIMLAPMAGITDSAFRRLAKAGGCSYVFTEMISATALARKNKKTLQMLNFCEEERPIAAQIFGSNKDDISSAVKIICERGYDSVNLNFGCPAPKILKTNSGAAVLKDLKLYSELISTAVKSSSVPVSVKIRPGFDFDDEKAAELSKVAEDSGASMVVIHGRFVSQKHTGDVNLEAISKAVSSVKIPVIANGGITSEESAENVIKATSCAGIMIGRGAIGDFNIFNRILHYLKTSEKLQPPSWEEKVDMFLTHARVSSELYGERMGVIKLRKVAGYYLKDLPNAKKIRGEINKIEKLTDLKTSLEQVFVSHT